MAQLIQLSKLNFSAFLVPKHDWTTSTGPPQQWKRLYLIFPVLKQQSTSIEQPLQLWKLGFRTFLVSYNIYSCGNCTGGHSWYWDTPVQPPQQWKQLYLIFPALKHESTSIVQPLQLWKLDFRIFLVMKDACRTSTTVTTTLCDLPSTDTGVHKHRIASRLLKLSFLRSPGSKTCLHNLHGHWTPRQWKRPYLIFPALKEESTSITQPLQLSKLNFVTFLVQEHTRTTSTGPPQEWKWIYLIFPALKQESTSIAQPLQLWKLGFRTFLAQKHRTLWQ